MKAPSVVFDLTVYLDAVLRADGASGRLLRRLVNRADYELVSSPTLLAQLERAGRDTELLELLGADVAELERWVAAVGLLSTSVEPGEPPAGAATNADPSLAAARAAGALLVTLDPDHQAAPPGDLEILEPDGLEELLDAMGRTQAAS